MGNSGNQCGMTAVVMTQSNLIYAGGLVAAGPPRSDEHGSITANLYRKRCRPFVHLEPEPQRSGEDLCVDASHGKSLPQL